MPVMDKTAPVAVAVAAEEVSLMAGVAQVVVLVY
jgi:hypothetical protein